MAQPVYESSPSSSYKFNRSILEYATQMPDKSNEINTLHSGPHIMSSRGNGIKRKLSRLEMMKIDFRQKLIKEKEDKLYNYHAAINREPKKSNSGGTVREFFAERRALEAQQNPSSLPPIQAHFNSVKGQRNQTIPPQRQRGISQQQELTEPASNSRNSIQRRQSNHQTVPSYQQSKAPAEIITTGQTGNLGSAIATNNYRNIYQRQKRTKGIDKQDPLPPLRKGTKKQINKPPTPNKRYEHFTDLSEQDKESDETHDTHMPTPPREAKPLLKRPKAPLRPVSNETSEDESSSVCTDDVPPNLRRLKAKALLQKQLSQQKINTDSWQGKAKLSDFQKWQSEQDEARQDRLDRFRNKTSGENVSDSEHEYGNTKSSDLAKREQELLEKIKHEQARLERLQNERQRLEEQEKQEKEEEKEWTLKLSEATTNNDEEERAAKPAAPKKKPVHTKQKKLEVHIDDVEEETPTDIHEQPDEGFKNFYAEAAAQAEQHQDEYTMPCSVCGRSFASDRLIRHEKVCAKNSRSQRKLFDARMQRAMGTGFEENVRRGKYKEEPEKKVKKVDWRAQHENFIRVIRYAKGVSDEPPPPTENPEYVQCSHCKRKFNPYTAERHIPKCNAPPKKKYRL